jgi:co-chaperonin GroES (HSP10)
VTTYEIKHARPLFRRKLHQAPAHPLGERVLVWEYPPESRTEGGIEVAEKHQKKYMAGVLIAAGDQAADKLYDMGAEIGDEVWYAQYAGLVEAWQHIVGKDDADCPHDSAWDFVPSDDKRWAPHGGPNSNRSLRACRSCGTLKLTETVIVMDVADLCLNVNVQERLEGGELVRKRGVGPDGRTLYHLERRGPWADSFETKGAK